MNHWLAKTEPGEYSWQDLVKDKKAPWDGVRNYQARNNLNKMKQNDPVMIYHSGSAPQVVGIARVAKESYPDISDPRWTQVDLSPLKELNNPVPLTALKANPHFAQSPLLRQSRLSVVPLTPDQYRQIEKLSLSPMEPEKKSRVS